MMQDILDNYLLHYSRVNNINLDSEESIKKWYQQDFNFISRELDEYFIGNKDQKILELGCGIGNILNYLKKKGYNNIVGIDNSLQQIEVCRKYVTDSVVCKDIFQFLQNDDRSFDTIVMFDLIEHFKKDNIQQLLELIYMKLCDGGQLLIRTPNMGSLIGPYIRYDDFTHQVGFTKESLLQILEEQQFRSVKAKNAYISRKREMMLNLVYRLVYKLYYRSRPDIITMNIILRAQK